MAMDHGLCGYTVIDADGIEQPCDEPTTGWRWYQNVDAHEDMLDAACELHENEGGRRIHAAEETIASVTWLADVRNGRVHADHRDPLGMVKVSDLLAALNERTEVAPSAPPMRWHGPECGCRELHHEPDCPVNVAWLAQREREAASHA